MTKLLAFGAQLARDPRGAVLMEYTLLLSLVALGTIAALIACGSALLRLFLYQEAIVSLPFP